MNKVVQLFCIYLILLRKFKLFCCICDFILFIQFQLKPLKINNSLDIFKHKFPILETAFGFVTIPKLLLVSVCVCLEKVEQQVFLVRILSELIATINIILPLLTISDKNRNCFYYFSTNRSSTCKKKT